MSRELLIQGGYVVTVDPAAGDLPEGDVLVTGDVITAGGAGLHTATPCAEVIDARGRLVIPGLVDTHRQVWQGAMGAFTPQITGAILDVRSLHLDGFGDVAATMVLGAGPADVETVIADGDVVKRDGKLVGSHVEKAREIMHQTRAHLRARMTT
jgi:cytosine/adenosine deaminase-related metal-dependent hydrolase